MFRTYVSDGDAENGGNDADNLVFGVTVSARTVVSVTDSSDLDGFLRNTMPFTQLLGVHALAAAPEEVRRQVSWGPDYCTAGGVLHGGALMTLADTSGAWCAFLNLPQGASTTTIESKTNFLRAIRTGHAMAASRPLHVGRTTMVIDTEVRDDDGRLVARTTQTQAVLGSDR